MNTIQPNLQSVSGRIEQFKKLTGTLATFRVNGIRCKAEHLVAAHIESWAKNPDCVCEFQGAYQQSRFGKEFVIAHGRREALAVASDDRIKQNREKQIEFYMDLLKDYSPEQLRWMIDFGGNHEYDREAARRLLERAAHVGGPTPSLSSPSNLDKCSGEAQRPTSHRDN